MKAGIYWYMGPYFRNGERLSESLKEWNVVQVHEWGASCLGSDSDFLAADVALMEAKGRFVKLEPPAEELTHPVDILKDLGVELTPEQEALGRAVCDAPGRQRSGMTQYCVHCPHCRAEHTMLDATLWPGTFLGRSGEAEYPGDPSEPQRCPNCSRWMQLILVGKNHELTVEKREAPQADPPEILGTGL